MRAVLRILIVVAVAVAVMSLIAWTTSSALVRVIGDAVVVLALGAWIVHEVFVFGVAAQLETIAAVLHTADPARFSRLPPHELRGATDAFYDAWLDARRPISRLVGWSLGRRITDLGMAVTTDGSRLYYCYEQMLGGLSDDVLRHEARTWESNPTVGPFPHDPHVRAPVIYDRAWQDLEQLARATSDYRFTPFVALVTR